jgi:D-glycero-D-manno-heptose 1,7-bisphosphate phosphatase
MTSPALFLDRDGVINVDRGYVGRIEEFEFVPGIFELARFAVQELSWPIIVITNQSGIGRGYFDEGAYELVTRYMRDRFRQENAALTHVYHCPYHPEYGIGKYRVDHPWRKPSPGMILQAARDFDLDLPGSVLIGDAVTDIEAATAAGIHARIRFNAKGVHSSAAIPHRCIRDLSEAVALLKFWRRNGTTATLTCPTCDAIRYHGSLATPCPC